jgi:asparagine synthase (glutamine-hydrolysing)
MCGIFGVISPGKIIDEPVCLAALDTLHHRGPDGMGAVVCNTTTKKFKELNRSGVPTQEADLFLGHRRLSIVDLSETASQPMCNEDGSVWTSFNGEIYNHHELRTELIRCGHRFKTDHSDTEVLVHGWEEWGIRLLDRLNGMFAFAIVDLNARKLLLARDRFGEKPLYFTRTAETVSFASELKALLKLGTTDRTIAKSAIHAFLGFGYVPAPLTIFQDVNKLSAGHYALFSLDDLKTWETDCYWELKYSPVSGGSQRNWEEEFFNTLLDSVDLRMKTDVPFGVFLSGGLDSTAVLRMTRKVTADPIRAFTIGFHDKTYDESEYADEAAARYKAELNLETIDEQAMLRALPTVCRQFDEPFADSSAIPTYLVSELASRSVKVCLSGDGGDELLAGYTRYRLHYWAERLRALIPNTLQRNVVDKLIEQWPEAARGKGLLDLIKTKNYPSYLGSLWDPYFFGERVSPMTYAPNLQRSASAKDINSMCLLDTKLYLPEDLMVKVDRCSMAVSLEVRAPLLDHRLFELVAQMPLSLRFDGRSGKLPFRRLLGEEMTKSFMNRPKRGFAVPLGRWFRGPLKSEIADVLGSAHAFHKNYIDPEVTQNLVTLHANGSRDQSARIWRVFMLENWYRNYGRSEQSVS